MVFMRSNILDRTTRHGNSVGYRVHSGYDHKAKKNPTGQWAIMGYNQLMFGMYHR